MLASDEGRTGQRRQGQLQSDGRVVITDIRAGRWEDGGNANPIAPD